MEEKKEWKKKIPMWIKEGLFEEVTDDRGTRILGYVNCSDKVLDFIEQEIDRAREEVEDKFREKFKKREQEMNVPYSEEDGKEFWQGYQEGYNQGLHDMIIDTHYLDEEWEEELNKLNK